MGFSCNMDIENQTPPCTMRVGSHNYTSLIDSNTCELVLKFQHAAPQEGELMSSVHVDTCIHLKKFKIEILSIHKSIWKKAVLRAPPAHLEQSGPFT